MKKILEILNSHSSEKGVKEYKDTVEKVKGAVDVNLEKVTGADIADSISRIERANYQTIVDSKKDGDADKYLNWNDYIGEYNLALQEIEKYNNFYDGEYTTAFINYESAAKAYSEKVKNLSQSKYKAVEDFAKGLVNDFKTNYAFKGTYNEDEIKSMVQAALSEQNALKTSLGAVYSAYEKAKNAYGNKNMGAVSELYVLKEKADFRVSEATRKGENLIENQNSGSGSSGSGESGGTSYIEPFTAKVEEGFAEALKESWNRMPSDKNIERFVYDGYSAGGYIHYNFSVGIYDAEGASVTDLDKNSVSSVSVSEPDENGEKTVTVKLNYLEKEYTAAFTVLSYLTLDVPVNLSDSEWQQYLSERDWSKYDKLSLIIPEGTGGIDFAEIIVRHHELVEKLGETERSYNEKSFKVLYPTIIPSSVTGYSFDLTKTSLNNVEFVKTMANPKVATTLGEAKETEIMPGVSVVSYRANPGTASTSWLQSVKFTDTTRKTKVTMPANYDLTGTYHGGIEGNVDFTNLGSTTMSGTVDGRDSFKPVYDTFVKGRGNGILPKLDNVRFSSIDLDYEVSYNPHVGGGLDLYGTEVDKLVSEYFKNSVNYERISGFDVSGVFDATPALNGYSMWDETGNHTVIDGLDPSIYSPYEIDVNALLLIARPVMNVRIVGDKKINVNSYAGGNMANVRFGSDMTGVSVHSNSSGIIEFEGDAPSYVDVGSAAKMILSKITHETKLGTGKVELKSSVTQAMANNLSSVTGSDPVNLYSPNGVTLPSGFAVSNDFTLAPSENARWERAGNLGKEYEEVE